MFFKIANSLFLAAFVLSALVQFNDPDALPWVVIYLAAAAMCVARIVGRLPLWLPPLLLVITLAWCAVLLPNILGQVSLAEVFDSLSMKTRDVEEAREIGGLLLVATWSCVLLIRRRTAG